MSWSISPWRDPVWAALATVVGVLIEVPIMLLAVNVVNRSKAWYQAGMEIPL